MNGMEARSKARIAIVIFNRQYLISWLDSGNIERLVNSEKFEVTIFAPTSISDLLPSNHLYRVIRVDSITPTVDAKHLVAMNWVNLRNKSLTFRFSLQRTFLTEYRLWASHLGLSAAAKQFFKNVKTMAWNVKENYLVLMYFFSLFRLRRGLYLKRLGKSAVLPPEIRPNEFDWMIIPCHAIDELTTDYISEAKEVGLKTIVAIDNWDNLTSKSVYVVKPDFLTVMGQRCVEHAENIHDIGRRQVLPFGLPRFDAYRQIHLAKFPEPIVNKPCVLYAGFSLAHSEKRVVDAIANYMDAKYGAGKVDVVYRPHPIPIPRIDRYEITNKNVRIHKYGNLERTSLPGFSGGLIDSLISASVVVGAPTTLMLESMILGRPCIIDATEDNYHRTTASNSARNFVHMKDLLAVDELRVGRSIAEVVKHVDELISSGSTSTKYNLTHLFDIAAPLYIDQLMNFLLQAQNK